MRDTDVRDEALASVLDRAAERIEATPADLLPDVLRRGSHRRLVRFGAIGVAMTVFVGAVAWAGLSLPSRDGTIPANVADWRTFASLDDNGWTIQVPPTWHITELPACENAPDRIGVMVTNVPFEFRDPDGGPPDCEDRLLFAGFPRHGVALAFMPRGILPGLSGSTLDTPLPLNPDLLHPTGGIVGGPKESFSGVHLGDETLGIIRRYAGPEVSMSDVTALDRMLTSFRVRGAPRWIHGSPAVRGPLNVTLTRPDTWRLSRALPVVIDAPSPFLQLTSPGVVGGGCRVFPWAGWIRLGGLEDGGVALVLSDASGSWGPPELPPRPDRFRFPDAIEDRTTCGDRVRALRFGFEVAGRPIYLDIAATWDLYRNEPLLLRSILDSIEVSG